MTLEIFKTKESDGDWYKIYVDTTCHACVKITKDNADEALRRAEEIFDFLAENKGRKQVIKSVEI